MWKIKTFYTYQDQQDWIAKNRDKYAITTLFLNNAYAVEFKRLRRAY